MIASSRQTDHPDHLAAIPDNDHKALPVTVIYGANGAGKSNLVKALAFLETLVVRGTEPKKPIGRHCFILDKASASQPTELSIQFVESGHVYLFGCRVTDKIVEAEWLSLLSGDKEISVYERLTNTAEEVTIEPGPVLTNNSGGDHTKALALTKVGVLPNQLFLHAVGKNLREQDQGLVLAGALRWFSDRLTIIPANASFSALALLVAQDKTFTDFAGEFLRKVGTGVDRLRVDTAEVEEGMMRSLGGGFQQIIDDMTVGASISDTDGTDIFIEKKADAKVQMSTIKSEHITEEGVRVTLPFSEESDGTRRLTHLLPSLHTISKENRLFVIDEIDRSLHPLLAKGFVRTFLNACAGKGSQLIFTTHDTTFLDLELLRRDEIWFVNKRQPAHTTELYSLAEYKVRNDLKIDKAYLQGRFEAVPPIEVELPDWVLQIMAELKPKERPIP